MPREVLLVSPAEPSGATWLINCLLLLGVRTYRTSARGMWRQEGENYYLNEHEEVLKKWLPALNERDSFRFRADLAVRWTHEWPRVSNGGRQILFIHGTSD